MSNQPGIPTQITVQNYDQLPGVGELLPLDQQVPQVAVGGRYDFDDGGLYVGGWFEGKANGYGICTGPNCQGEYSGSWSFGFEVSGIYKWPQGTTYQGQWQNGRRHGLGIEYRGNWSYKGEWTQGNKGRYGVRCSNLSQARYEGTFANGLQDGYGSETYADGGNFQGQWFRGMRHGFGVRQSASYGSVLGMSTLKPSFLSGLSPMDRGSTQSLDADGRAVNSKYRRDMNMVVRGGFVLVGRPSGLDKNGKVSRRRNSVIEKSNAAPRSGIFRGLLKKQKSTGDIDMTNLHGATISRASHQPPSGIHSVTSSTDSISLSGHMRFGGSNALLSKQFGQDFDGQSNASFIIDSEQIDPTVTETYMGEWKDDKRSGFGICERSDGLVYAGEWYQNKKNGYGITSFPDGTTEEGKYKNNLLIVSSKKRIAFVLRPTKLKERIDSAMNAAKTAQQTAMKKADIAISRTATARDKAEQAVLAANQAQNDSKLAVLAAKQFGALVIDPTTNTISPTDQASTLSNLNDTESIINRIKNQNLISLNDGQLSVPEIPLRRRLSQHNEARKSFRSQSIKDVQNLEFNNLHKINQPTPEKPDAFPGRQASLRGRQQQPNDPNSNPYQTNLGVNSSDYLTSQAGPAQQPPFHSASSNPPSTYGYQTESPHSFASTQSRNNLIRQTSLGQTNSQFQQQQHPSSSMYQSQPHLVRPNSSASSSINHPYTSQRPPLNVQTSFDLGKSMVDHMDHYQSLHNRYASTSKINQKTANRNRTFASSGNLPGQQSMTNLQNRNLLVGSNQPSQQQQQQGMMGNLNRNTSNLPSHFQHTPDSGVGSLEESSAAAAHYQPQQQAHQLNQQHLQNPLSNQLQNAHLLSPSQQALLQPHQLQQHMLQSQLEQQQRQGMLNSPGPPQQQFMNPAGMHPLAQLSMPQSQFNPMASMQPYGGSQFNLNSPMSMQQPGLQQAALNSLQSMQQQQQFNPLGQFNPMAGQPGQMQMQQQMWNPNQQQSPFQSMAGQMNQFPQSAPFQHSPPIPNQQFQQPSPPLTDPSLAFQQQQQQQQQQQPNRQAIQQQIQQQQQLIQPNELMNRANAQSMQSKERSLEQHYGKQGATDSGAEPKRSSWRTASLFNNRPGTNQADSNKNELLKRKPSLQTNFNKDPKIVMSREQVSVMSSREREHRRKEAELAVRLSKNPFLYFSTSAFRDWLREQQLILIVLSINLVVVLIVYYLFCTENNQK